MKSINTVFSEAKKIAKKVSGKCISLSLKKYSIFVFDESTDMNNVIVSHCNLFHATRDRLGCWDCSGLP